MSCRSTGSPLSSARMRSMRTLHAGRRGASIAAGQRRCTRARVAAALGSGSCSPAMPRGLQAMPQVPIGVSNRAKP